MSRKSPAKLRQAQARRNVGRDRQRRREEHLGEINETYCVCGKVACESEKAATALALHYFARKGGRAPQRVYECGVMPGIFHWTSQR